MWVTTQDGFTSAVLKQGKFQLRARDRESLQRMGFKGKRIVTGVGTDYPFRVYLTKREYKRIVCRQIDAIDYSNFKSRVLTSRGRRYSDALHDVWTAMLKVEPKNAKSLLGDFSFRTYTTGKRVADWWPEYDAATRATDRGAYDAYDAWEDRDRDFPGHLLEEGMHVIEGEDDLTDEQLEALAEYESLHRMTDEQWMASQEAQE